MEITPVNPQQAARPAAPPAPAKPPVKDLFNREEAAAYLGVSIRKLDGMLAKREVDVTRIGRRVLLRKQALDRLIEARTVAAYEEGKRAHG